MIRLDLYGAHTRLGSSLCAECPHGPSGCCVSPPPVDWSDIGRMVALGGRDFVLERIATGAFVPSDRGLRIRRVKGRQSNTEPMRNQCVFFGRGGCTITPDQRPATCNYYLCEDAYAEGGARRGTPEALFAREAHELLREHYTRWDDELTARIRSTYPDGAPWDAAFLDWLGQSFVELVEASGEAFERLTPVGGDR
jgi:hypothetical protein